MSSSSTTRSTSFVPEICLTINEFVTQHEDPDKPMLLKNMEQCEKFVAQVGKSAGMFKRMSPNQPLVTLLAFKTKKEKSADVVVASILETAKLHFPNVTLFRFHHTDHLPGQRNLMVIGSSGSVEDHKKHLVMAVRSAFADPKMEVTFTD